MDSTSPDVFSDNTVPFRSAEERENELSDKPPQCLLDIPVNPKRVPLTPEQEKLATAELIDKSFMKLKFPRERAFRPDPAIPNQRIGLISFIPSRHATPDTDGCFGVIKIRGNFANTNEAQSYGEYLIRDFDSYAEIDLCHVGHDFPLMIDNTMYCKSTAEVDIRKKIEENVKDHMRSKREKEQKEMKEVVEREKILKDPTHRKEIDDSLDPQELYTKLRVKKANCLYNIEKYRKGIEEAQVVLAATEKDIDEMEAKDPELSKSMEYLNRFSNQLKTIGVNEPEQNPVWNHLKDNNKYYNSSSEEKKE